MLFRSGVTPSAGLVRAVRERVTIPVQVLLRPRPGSFVHDDGDVAAMLADLRDLKLAGADGVVLGSLTPDHLVDRETVARLVERARPLGVAFHRAIDRTPDLGAALATLAELGIERVLTSGGAAPALAGAPPRKGAERRERLARIAAAERATVLFEAPGRTAATVRDLAAACGTTPSGASWPRRA